MVVAGVLVVMTLVVMASGRVPPVLALGCCLAIAGLLRIASPEELFSGLSNSGVITVAGMLVIAKGVVRTGLVARVTWRLLSGVTTAGHALRRLIVPIGVMSSLINTTPIVAMLVPATRELEQSRRIPAREVLLPITHATTLAGSVTLIGTSSNLLIAGIAATAGVHIAMISFAPVALPVALAGWVVLLVAGPRMLSTGAISTQARPRDWRVEIPVSAHANAIGRTASALGVEQTQEFLLEAIWRRGRELPVSEPMTEGDTLVYAATEAGVVALWASPRFGQSPQKLYAATAGPTVRGTLRDIEDDGDLEVIAAQSSVPLRDTPVIPGEPVYVTCDSSEQLRDNDSLTLWQDAAGRAPQPGKTYIALAILAGVIVAASFNLVAVSLAAFAGALLMVVLGVLTPRSAVRALDWNVLFILAGSIGLGAIVTSSGLADEIANVVRFLSAGNLVLVIAVFALTTTILTNVTTNAAAASILTPIAISIAAEVGVDPVIVLALVATCISFTFLNPFSHQSNLMVMRPGGYSSAEFVRFGIPLLLVAVIAAAAVTYLLLVWRT
ncbi:MAG TPA: SLC13 family permease [Candidatus Nanopelagicales bacterium]|jgi:di/tricarboxylate transporter